MVQFGSIFSNFELSNNSIGWVVSKSRNLKYVDILGLKKDFIEACGGRASNKFSLSVIPKLGRPDKTLFLALGRWFLIGSRKSFIKIIYAKVLSKFSQESVENGNTLLKLPSFAIFSLRIFEINSRIISRAFEENCFRNFFF